MATSEKLLDGRGSRPMLFGLIDGVTWWHVLGFFLGCILIGAARAVFAIIIERD